MMYVIKPGDTLSQLAQKFGTTTAQLARDNSISDPNKIYAGHMIVVPGARAPISDWWVTLKDLFRKPLW
jgi:LysM repeat protein